MGLRQYVEFDNYQSIKHCRSLLLLQRRWKQSREECLDAGATDYISKPINLDQLFSLMHVWLYTKGGISDYE